MFGDLVETVVEISRQTCGNENGTIRLAGDVATAQLYFELEERNCVICHSCNINCPISFM